MTQGHFDIKRAPVLDSEGRIRDLRPEQLLVEMGGVGPGMTCIDLGCGTGTFAIPLAQIVSPGGVVYAVDDSPDMLGYLRARKPPPNLKPLQADARRTGLPGGIADFCLLAFLLHEVDDHAGLMSEAHRLLKPGGRVLMVEWRAEMDSPGPPRRLRLSREKVEALFSEAGFTGFRYVEWSANHYAATAARKAAPTG